MSLSFFFQFIKIQFSKSGRIAGATIEKYLLEKTRLIHQTAGERNYHIFYQLLRGASPELRQTLHLSNDSLEAYDYISSSAAASSIPNVNDCEEWAVTTSCMESIGIDAALQQDIFRLLASILHLGNVVFDNTAQSSEEDQVSATTAETAESLRLAAALLGFEAEDLLTCLTKQNMYVGGATIIKLQSFAQVKIYSQLNSFYLSHFNRLFKHLLLSLLGNGEEELVCQDCVFNAVFLVGGPHQPDHCPHCQRIHPQRYYNFLCILFCGVMECSALCLCVYVSVQHSFKRESRFMTCSLLRCTAKCSLRAVDQPGLLTCNGTSLFFSLERKETVNVVSSFAVLWCR